ncbi:hypothetical protein [Sphingobacterium faecale]|uniref:Uncharacterized protein n=1 Tax=Sphingobacterium faecale TaxID=2803775 RepID=A0ABS1R2N6_9SPHI|nr:hypothetical protein [Sphingobacterium faecale]MBL1408705.1 hypothetical protein [Sphingobacterium faecale]
METNTSQQNEKTAPSVHNAYRPNRVGQWLKTILVIAVFFMLSFHWMPDHGHIFPKEQLSLANTIISNKDVDQLIQRHNEASGFERTLIRQEYIHKKMYELGVIFERVEEE